MPTMTNPAPAASHHDRALPGLSPLQSQIMRVLWNQGGELTARQVHDRLLPKAVSVAQVLVALGSLDRANLASATRHGRHWHYRAGRSRDEHLAAVIREALAAAPDQDAVLQLALPSDPESEPEPWHPLYPRLSDGSGLDPSIPHPARVHDYLTGGKDNYLADRQAGDELLSVFPGLTQSVLGSRCFVARAVRYLAGEQGISQFLEIGCGLPTVDNTHQIAQSMRPDAAVVYADADPLVVAFASAILTSGPAGKCGHILADARDPADVIAGAAVTLDFTRPVAILMANVLNFVTSQDQVQAVVRRLTQAIAPGSYLVICHPTAEVSKPAMQAMTNRWNELSGAPTVLRTRAELTRLFDGLDLTEPGIVSCPRWRPDIADFNPPPEVPHFGGAGRKRDS